MPKATSHYVCTACGHTHPRWVGKCANCNEWGTVEEEALPTGKSPSRSSGTSLPASVRRLSEHEPKEHPRFSSSIDELDRVLGGGIVPGSAVVLSAEPGAGKALALDTPLPTPSGWTTMDKVQVGDYLFDETGAPCVVLAISEIMTNRPVYRVEFDDGSVIVADGEHLWSTLTRKSRRHAPVSRARPRGVSKRRNKWLAQVGTTSDHYYCGLYETMEQAAEVAYQKRQELGIAEYNDGKAQVWTTEHIRNSVWSGDHLNHAIPVTQALDLPDQELVLDPYVLGVWLGDGHSAGGRYTSADPEISERLQVLGEIVQKHRAKYNWGIQGLITRLRHLGVLNNKHIPDLYLRASIAQRKELLAGLLDTDGSKPNRNTASCEFYSSSLSLAESVRELVLSLGYKASFRTRRAVCQEKDCGPTYTIAFTAWDSAPFHLGRKNNLWREGGIRGQRRYITAVEPVDSVPVKCVQVSSPSRLYLAGKTMIPTHNSTLSSTVVDNLAAQGKRVAYINGEESGEQIRLRTDRLGLQHSHLVDVSDEIEISRICALLESGYDFAVIDSIQTLYDSELTGAPGSVGVVKQVGQALVRAAKTSGVAVLLIGHVTKEGNLAGPRHLEHMVDVVLSMEGERTQAYRILRAQKNRFGSTNEIGVFEMTGAGLVEVKDPTTLFLQEHENVIPGAVICPTIEGSRPMLVEVQALTQATSMPNPMRRVRGIDRNRLDMILAVLNQRSGLNLTLGSKDVYVNISGGLRIEEPALDLAICVAVASAATGRPVKAGTAVFGEVSLLGEVRPVHQADRRTSEASKLGRPNVIGGPKQGTKGFKSLGKALEAALENS